MRTYDEFDELPPIVIPDRRPPCSCHAAWFLVGLGCGVLLAVAMLILTAAGL